MQKIYPEGTLSDVFILNILPPWPLAAKGSRDAWLFHLPLWKEFLGFMGLSACPAPPVRAWHPEANKGQASGAGTFAERGCLCLREGCYSHPGIKVSGFGKTGVSSLEQTSKPLSQTAR